MWKPISSEVKWAECSFIIGTGCWVQVFTWSLIAQSVCERAFSLLVIWCLRFPSFCIHQRKTACLLSIRKSLACARASKLTKTNMYVCMCACTFIRITGWLKIIIISSALFFHSLCFGKYLTSKPLDKKLHFHYIHKLATSDTLLRSSDMKQWDTLWIWKSCFNCVTVSVWWSANS